MRLEVLASENDVYKEMYAKSIEHIFPQKPKASSNWVKDPDFSEHPSVVNTIGNLVLLSKGKNSSASNNEFDVKKTKYLKDRVSDYPRSIKILDETDWTIAKIKSNTAELEQSILSDP
ncbi:MAG: HNH endonuclease family protein [Syntrophomonas sp.]